MNNLENLFEIGMDRKIPSIKSFRNPNMINLGCGIKTIEGAVNLDYPEWDADVSPIPVADGAVDVICAFHFLEHIADPVGMLQEFQRVLAPGGVANIVVPYYTSQMQAHDLDHKSQFCEDTWKILFSNPYYNKNKIEWHFKIGTNVIMGIAERNLALITQLVRE